jgi:hypothetical protein
MTKVYVVMGNWCDDTWIECICRSKGIAEAIAKQAIDRGRRRAPNLSYWYWVKDWEISDN